MAIKYTQVIGKSLEKDMEGHRTYKLKYRIETDDPDDGPEEIINNASLPAVGSTYSVDNDSDPWAFRTPVAKITQQVTGGEPSLQWIAEIEFTTKPMFRCNTNDIENPLSEPQKISGSFSNGTKKATKDKDDNSIVTTSFEIVPVEFDESYPTVVIEQNVATLGLSTFAPMVDTVNDATLWGLSSRKIKLAKATWQRKLYGTCTYYYTRRFEFHVNANTFDRSDVPNKGKKIISGEWDENGDYNLLNINGSPPVVSNPAHYIRAVDRKGNPIETYINKATGVPSTSETFLDTVQYYGESNFTLLGIPSSL